MFLSIYLIEKDMDIMETRFPQDVGWVIVRSWSDDPNDLSKVRIVFIVL